MLVKIESKEKEALQYACELADLTVSFYTAESMTDVVQAEILERDKSEPSMVMIWHVARQLENKVLIESLLK